MHVVITGGGGFLGRRLTLALLEQGQLTAEDGTPAQIEKLTIFDLAAPQPPLEADPRLEIVTGDITKPDVIEDLITEDVNLIFHLAAIVSGEAEENFDLGMQVNLAATQSLLERCRQLGTKPRIVFASSIAVFGGDMPDVIEDGTALTPQSSYGTQKAIGELLVNDYSRKGYVDGRVMRLPTIVVRPGKPNRATSTFASSIIREPLQGESAVCPVSADIQMWIMSPKQAIRNFIHAAQVPASDWSSSRIVALPGLTVSVQELVDTLEAIAGPNVANRIVWEHDPFIQKIVSSWPYKFAPKRAEALGFAADASIHQIIQSFIDDELDGNFVE